MQELQAQIASNILKGQMLKSYKLELKWRQNNPSRSVAKKQIIGLCSYDYQLDPEYKKLYALDSKSYYRFQAGIKKRVIFVLNWSIFCSRPLSSKFIFYYRFHKYILIIYFMFNRIQVTSTNQPIENTP